MVFRRSLQNVTSRAAYFSGDAHPAAFEAMNINLARMVSLANSIEPEAIPPQVRVRVLSEDLGTEGVDFFGQGLSEQLFDTPAAIARVWRSRAGRRTMLVTAEDTRDPNGRPLSFEWHLLQGDPAKVKIEPLGPRARITLDWHDPFRISEDNPVTSSRIDIGVFANNGAHDSAPAMLSWYCPPESRTYAPGPDGPRILAIDYADRKGYADPMLFARADWRDEFAYADGRLTGWTRRRPGRPDEEFTADGARILTRDPLRTEPVIHALRRTGDTLVIDELSPGADLDYPVPAPGASPAGSPREPMIISRSRGFIFVHVHKTAGEAVTRALMPYLGPGDLVLGGSALGNLRNLYWRRRHGLTKHSRARRIREFVGPEAWERAFTFAFMRDPVERMRSLYAYYARMAALRRRRAAQPRLMLPGLGAGDPLHWPGMQAYLATSSFSEFIRHPRLYHDPGAAPQIDMVSENGRVIVDRIGRFERLAEDFAALAAAVGAPGARLARVNASPAPQAEIAPDDRAWLRDRFQADIAALDA